MKTATLPLGHADGISRAYGNGMGWVRINGHKAPICGNVCMDMIMVDITGIDCKEGDEVIVLSLVNKQLQKNSRRLLIQYPMKFLRQSLSV